MIRSFLAAVFVCGCVPGLLQAARLKVWHHHAAADYEKAHFQHAVVSSEGVLRLARQLRPLPHLDATHVWDLVEDRDGNLIAATGDEGKIYKITPEGKVSVLHSCKASQVFCLALAADGSIYAGTGPGGQVLRIDPRGQARVVCETHQTYVWALAIDPATQMVYAGTGPRGRVYCVSPEGQACVFYTARQEHILCLAVGADRTLYAGTDKGGLVYRIDPQGKGFVLHQAAQSEVRSLKVTPDGLYVGTSSPGRSRGTSSSGSSSALSAASLESESAVNVSASKTKPRKTADKPEKTADKPEKAANKSDAESSAASKDGSRGSPAPAPSTPSGGENSVYRIAADGTAREVFREKALVLSLLRQGKRFLVGTGMEGQLFEVDEAQRERSEIARLDHSQILCLYQRKDGSVVVGTGDPGKLYELRDWYAVKGTVVSEVLDAKLISRWGSLGWHAETPEGTSVSVAVRSGNVAEPDDTWSDWSAEQTDPHKAVISAPAARFLQYRVTMTTDRHSAVSPAVRAVFLRYTTTNLAPEVSKVEVPDLNAATLDNPKKLKIKWSATDPNEDELTYAVLVKKEGWGNWVKLEDDLDKTDFEWDTTTTPSGLYQVKVVASDRKDNAEQDALQVERVSEPFVVCHTAPGVQVKVAHMEGDQAVVEATATSPLVRLTAASFAVNGKKWSNVFPDDGLFDGPKKTFKFKTEGLRPGTYVLVLRVKDAAGNLGSSDVVFSVQPRPAR